MSFTERFLTIPIKTFSVQHKELTGKEECTDTVMRLNPFDISRYHPSFDSDQQCVRVIFKDGSSVLCYLNMTEFENLLDNHN
jgi:hypothetical protein